MTRLSITTGQDFGPEMTSRGYCVFRGCKVVVPPELNDAADKLKSSFARMPQDEFAVHDTWRRRYSIFVLVPKRNELFATSLSTYYQSPTYNQIDGGVKREFQPIEPEVRENVFLGELIRFYFRHSSLSPAHSLYQVGVHQIRQTPRAEDPAFSHPLHKDGESVTWSVLMTRENVAGGTGVVADNDKQVIWQGQQEQFLDTFGVVDELVYHMATPVTCKDASRPARRDVLLIDFTPLTPTIPNAV